MEVCGRKGENINLTRKAENELSESVLKHWVRREAAGQDGVYGLSVQRIVS